MHEHQHLAGFYFEISLCSSVLLIVAVDLSTWQRYRLMASNECVGLIFRGWIYAPSFDADSLTGPRFLPIKPDLFKRSVLVGDSAAVTLMSLRYKRPKFTVSASKQYSSPLCKV